MIILDLDPTGQVILDPDLGPNGQSITDPDPDRQKVSDPGGSGSTALFY